MLQSIRDRKVVPAHKRLPANQDLVDGRHWWITELPHKGPIFEGKKDRLLSYRNRGQAPSDKMRDAMKKLIDDSPDADMVKGVYWRIVPKTSGGYEFEGIPDVGNSFRKGHDEAPSDKLARAMEQRLAV